jgi:hypothetical protein
MACCMTCLADFISWTSMVAKRMARKRRLFGSHTTHILKPKMISHTLRIHFFRRRSSGAFSFFTLPHPVHCSVDCISEASSSALTFLGKKRIGCKEGYHLVKKFFQGRCSNSCYGRSNEIRTHRASYFGWLFTLIRITGSFFSFPRLHVPSLICLPLNPTILIRLTMKDDRVNVPEEFEACDNTHQVNENNGHERHSAFPFF